MDRLSESGAIAGSKELWTCRAAVAPPPRTAPPRPDGRAALSPDPASPAARDPRGCSSPFPRRASLRRRLRPRENAATLLRGARVAALVLAAAALALGVAENAAAQTTLVSNVVATSGVANISFNQEAAQAFTTGATGATVSSVEIISSDTQGDDFDLSLCETSANDRPTSTCTELTAPSSFAAGTLVFTAPANTTLDPTTTYAVLMTPESESVRVPGLGSNDEDTGGAMGWTIADTHQFTNAADDWRTSTPGGGRSLRIAIKGTLTASANTAPTSANTFVYPNEDTDYTFSSADFPFTDTDTGDSLASVKIVTLPASGKGTLSLSGTAIPSTDLPKTVLAADLGNLKYSPPANANVIGSPAYTTFTFKVNDGTVDSDDTYSMNIDVRPMNDPVTGKPGITGTAQVGRTLTATVGTIADVDGVPNPFFNASTTVQWIQVDGVNESDISGATSETYAVVTADEGKKIKVKVSFEDDDGTVEGPLTSDAYPSSGTVIGAVNAAPTGADKTLTIGSDTAYTFTADDFGFADVNVGDTLDSVRIVTVPGLGTLALDGTAVSLNDVIPSADIDGDKLTFTPVAGAIGEAYTTFTFKVNDGTVDSDNAYTMTFNVRVLSCAVPRFGSRREHWYGEVTVEAVAVNATIVGYGLEQSADAGSLAPNAFMIGSNSYTIFAAYVQTGPLTEGAFVLGLAGSDLTTAEAAALKVYVCDSGGLDFSDAGHNSDPVAHIYTWNNASLDWSPPVATRTLYLSLPANNAATGEPAISGTATAGQVLTATTGTIADADGLPSTFTYQWLRVDADGTSNEEDISGEIAATYTLTDDDGGKTVKVKVSFTDNLSGEEERTSAAYPSSGTVTAASTTNTPPTAADNTVTTGEDRPYTFTADDFEFDDTDTGDTLASVKIVTPPALGTLALDGTAVMADDVVTEAQIDADMLTFRPAQDAHGAPYTTFTFKVNDGTVDSADAYTMTIDVTDAPPPVCTAPSFGDRREIWSGTVTVGTYTFLASTLYGYSSTAPAGALDDQTFTIGSNDYTIARARVALGGSNSGQLAFELLDGQRLTTVEVEALRLHVCDTVVYNFSGATTLNASYWSTTLDWSPPVVTRTVYLSLPANHPATGEPAITGTAQAGQELTADASPIMDTDGLTGVDFTYQWLRVDADGMSNPADITDATAATYSLTAADVGKKIKVKVSFTDELSGKEERTSAAYPSSGTVTVAANTTAPALLSVTVTSTPRKTTDTYGAREHIEFSMTFDAPVTVTGDPTFDFDLGGPSTASWYAGSGTTTLRFSHAVSGGSSGDQDTNGISWAMNAIELNGGTIAGTENAVTAILTHAAQSNLAGHKVDGRTTAVTPATVTDVVVTSTPMLMASGSTTADTYGFGETIVITVTVSEAVEVEGDPVFRFSLTNPGSAANNPQATYDRTRSIATTIVFTYTVQAGDMDNNGIWIGTHSQTFSLDANDRIRTASQQIDIDLTHTEEGTQDGHKVDGSLGAPTVPPDPTAPTLVSATATTLTIEWTHPGDGGSPLTRNFIEYRVEGTTDWTNWYRGETPTQVTRTVIRNLTAATAYDVRVHATNAIGNSSWVQSATAFSTLAGMSTNTPPTAANNTVTTAEDRPYAFMADDFGFADTDAGATLASVTIVTVPAAGTLALDGTAVMALDDVTKAQIDADMLIFRPARDAHGVAYTTFTFKVNDGTVDSASAYTMTIDVTDAPAPVCAVPDIAGDGRRQIWTGTVTVAPLHIPFTTIVNGYGFELSAAKGSLLPSRAFSIGSHNYTIVAIGGGESGKAVFTTDGNDSALTTAETTVLRLHLCDESFDFHTIADQDDTQFVWDASLDWSHPVVTRTVYLSLPGNNAATGEPAITGTAQVGQVLTADASPIMDDNGLPSIFTYQWLRVDADGTSNEEDITGETDATYTLTDDDLGKKVKVKVSFVDILGSNEQRTSAPTATVIGLNSAPVFSQTTQARSIAENTAAGQNVGAAVTATDADAGDTLGYTLGGTDAGSFDFVESSGQIRTKSGVSYDHEAKASYTVTVTASDGTATAVASVTISVTDVDEPPSAPATPMVSAVSGSTTRLSVSWAAPANAGKPAIANYDVQYRVGSSGTWSDGPEDVAGTSTTIASLVANTNYEARVRATNAEGDSGWSDPPGSGRTNAPDNNAPVFDPAMPEREIAENTAAGQNVGAAVTATDADAGDTLGYTLGGTDAGSFDFVESSGQIRTKSGVSYDHEAKASYTVTVTASDGTATAVASVTISVTDVDEPPSAPATPMVSAVSGSTTRLSVSWAAPANAGKPAIANYDVQYRVGSSGTWSDGPEDVAGTSTTIASLVANTNYEARVRATNAEGDSGWSDPPGSGRTNAPDNNAPVFDPAMPEREIAENTAAGQNVGAAVTATDADAGDTLGYTLGGTDAGSFDFVESSGQIRTKSGVSYDHEAKASYTVTVTASDGTATAVASVTISVTDVDEPPSAPATPMVSAVSGSTTRLSVSWAAPANAGKPAIANYDVQYRAGSSGTWTDGPEDVATTTATITSLVANTLYEARVRATNAEGDSGWSDPPGSGRTNTLTNNAPVFDPAMPEREIAENTAAGVNVGAPVTATDADAGDTLSYTLGGADVASFDFVETTGQIRTKAGVSYDHEAKSSYTVTVTASDGTATADASVTISITDVDEPPSAPATPAVSAVSGSTTRLSVSWAAPANAGKPAIASYDVQYRAGTSGSWSDGPENVAATTATVTGLVADTLYQARVRATNAEGDSGWSSPPGSGRTNAPSTSAPGAPRDLGTAPGDGRVTLAWTAPGSDGAAALEKYRYRVSANAGSSWDPDWTDVPDGADAGDSAADETTFTVSGLINGTEYVFQLRAVNSVGEGPAASAADTPVRAPLPPGSGFLVGNFGQPADGAAQIYVTHDIVGVFTTGARGADLHNIELRLFTRRPNIAVLPIPSVTLYRASVTDSRATRGARVAALTAVAGSPQPANTAQTVAFAAPSGTRLDAGATYLVVLEETSYVRVESTTFPAEDAGGAPGWAIDGIGAGNNSPYSYQTTASLLMRVNGTVAGATVTTAPEAPASLGARAGDAEVTLRWTPPRSDGGAGIEKYQVRYSAGSRVDPDTAWTDVPDGSDSGTSRADERSVSVTELDNGRQYAFELRAVNSVRAGAAATATATPAPARRTGFLVSNFGQPVDGSSQISVTQDIVAAFTAGALGATLDSIEFRLYSRTPDIAQRPSATLYRGSVTDTRATLGTRVATLTAAPGSPRPAASAQTIVFTAPGGTRLEAGATYLVVLEGSGYVRVEDTNSFAQDAGGASGWTIDGVGAGNSSPYSYGTSDSLLMSVNGTTARAQRQAVRAVTVTGEDDEEEEEPEEQEPATTPDPDRGISLSTSSPSAIEGQAVTISVRRAGPTDRATTVTVQVLDSALNGAWPMDLVFRSGAATATAAVAIGFDGARPASRTVTVRLASVKEPYSVGSPSSFTLNVTDRDAALSVADASVSEGPGARLAFAVTLDRTRDRKVLVRYATSDGTATQGEDYTGVSGTLRFAPGETTKTVSVTVLDDTHNEGSETLTLTLSSPRRAVIDDDTAVGTIVNSDPLPDAWLSRFGRAASDQVVQSIGRRLEGGTRESHLTVMGWRVDSLFESSHPERDGRAPRPDAPGWQANGSVRAPDGRIGAPRAMTGATRGVGAMSGPGAARPAFDGAMTQGFPPMQGGSFQSPARAMGGLPANAGGTPGAPGGLRGAPGVVPVAVHAPGAVHAPAARGRGGPWANMLQGLLMKVGAGGDVRAPGLRDMVMGSSFYYGYSPDAGPLRGMNRLTAWGESASTRFSGAEGKLSLDGEVNTAILGADGEWGRWLAGLALSYSEGEGGYRQVSAKGGAVSSTLSGINPYARYRLDERTSLWATLGYGSGRLTLTPDGAESALETDMTNAMAAFGGRGVLSMRAGETGQFELALRTDAMLTNTASMAVAGLSAGEGATSRIRLILEGTGSLPAFGGVLAPKVEAGLRYDGGDAETGAGLEVGGGLAYEMARLTVQVDGRVLLTHRDRDYEEWGYSLSFVYQPGEDGRGLRYQAGSQWGAAQSGVQSLWSLQNAGGLANGAPTGNGQRYTAELGYGFGVGRLWYPYVATESGGASSQALRFGLNLNAASDLEAGLEIGRRPHMSGQIKNDILLRWSARW